MHAATCSLSYERPKEILVLQQKGEVDVASVKLHATPGEDRAPLSRNGKEERWREWERQTERGEGKYELYSKCHGYQNKRREEVRRVFCSPNTGANRDQRGKQRLKDRQESVNKDRKTGRNPL